MRRLELVAIGFALAVSLTTAAPACTFAPPPVRLPGESDDAYSARSKATFEFNRAEDARSLQSKLFEESDGIYLARVATSAPVAIEGWGMPVEGRRITAEVLHTVKGEQPDRTMTMADQSMSSCGLGGGGPATSEKPGALILVFANVSFVGGRNFGLPVASIREARLMAALNEAGMALRGTTGSPGQER